MPQIMCSKHGQTDTIGKNKVCRLCNIESIRKTRYYIKMRAIDYKGGCCSKCGYSKSIIALDFHHRNPQEKSFNVSDSIRSWAATKQEIDKCDLLCSNCHREESQKFPEETTNWQEIFQKTEDKRKIRDASTKCQCGQPKSCRAKSCASCCSRYYVGIKPTKEELEKLIWSKSMIDIGSDLGVSANTIKRWAKQYGIDRPPHGYWVTKRNLTANKKLN